MIKQNPRNSVAGWYFTSDEIAETISNGHMINPSIDLSNPCNLNCPYCYIEEKNSPRKIRRPNELTLEETLHIIEDLNLCGARSINIVGAGEPTIDPHFEEVIEYIFKNGMTTVLFTNGIRFSYDQQVVRFLYEHNVSVVLKFNSVDHENQDLVAGREGYATKRDIALDFLIDLGFSSHEPTRLAVDIIVYKGNLHEILEIHKWCRSENIFPIAGEFIPTGRTEGGKFEGYKAIEGFDEVKRRKVEKLLQPITNEDRVKLLNELRNIDAHYGISHHEHFAYYGGGICTQILGLCIDIEGNIWPCVARKEKTDKGLTSGLLGNVKKGNLPSEIWKNNSYIRYLRHSFDGGCQYKHRLELKPNNKGQFG